MSNRHQKLNKTKAKLQALGHPVYHVPLAGHFCIDGNCINPRTKHLQVCLALSPKHLKSPRIPHQPPITTLCQLDVCMAFFGGGQNHSSPHLLYRTIVQQNYTNLLPISGHKTGASLPLLLLPSPQILPVPHTWDALFPNILGYFTTPCLC
jgi:hypothetical protein